MPVRKHSNKKNVPASKRDTAIVPKKEDALKKKLVVGKTAVTMKQRVTALSTAGKKKKPK